MIQSEVGGRVSESGGVYAISMTITSLPVDGHAKVRYLKRLKLSCLKDDTAKSAGEMLLQIARSSAGFADASAY